MTIAIGILASDGVILCADSQYTSDSKTEGQKIFIWTGKYSAVVFAFAGNVANATMLIQDCQSVLTNKIRSRPSITAINQLLRKMIKSFHMEYIDTLSSKEAREDAGVDLIIAIAAKGEQTKLFYTSDAAMVEFKTYQLVGTGGYLGEYMTKRAYDRHMKTDDAIVLAMHALAAVKTHDASCGGPSQFMTIRSGIVSGVVPFDVKEADVDALLYESRSANQRCKKQIRLVQTHFPISFASLVSAQTRPPMSD